MAGIGGLAIYVNGDGFSARPPLNLAESEEEGQLLLGIQQKVPFLITLTSNSVNIFR